MRRVGVFALIAILLLASPVLGSALPDFYGPRAGVDADTTVYLDALSGSVPGIARLRARLERTPTPKHAADGWSFLCKFDLHIGGYATAIDDCKRAVRLDPAGGDAQTLAIAELLAGKPAPSFHGSARVPVSPGVQVPVEAGRYNGVAIADTGAGISFMMHSVAEAAGVKKLGVSGKVGTATSAVIGQLGLIPEVKIGGAFIDNIPVVVMPDAKLVFSNGKETVRLPFLMSLYALAGFGRIAWLDHDKWLAIGSAAPRPMAHAVPMIWHPLGIAVPLRGPGGVRAAHFDSGANISFLFDDALPLLSATEKGQLAVTMRTIGGVGGVVRERVRKLPVASFVLAGQPLVLKNVKVVKEPDTGEVARLGEDVFQMYSTVVFDF